MLSHTTAETKSTDHDHTIKMKSGSVFTAPTSWKAETHDNYVHMAAPENDLSIYFLEAPATQNLTGIATEAWKQIQPDFNLQASQEFSPPLPDWEKTFQVIYDTPTSESRMVMAMVRIFKGQAYISLIEGKTAGFARRSAELTIMTMSWKPIGFKEIQLSDNEAKKWTETDTQSFEQFISGSMQRLEIPGTAIAIIRQDGTSIYSKGFGTKQLGSNDPVTVDTPFMIGSTTKSLTTLLMASLVTQKKLSWETRVTDILPDFSLADVDLTKQLTIRHTVSASTGMPAGGFECLFKYNGIKPEDRLLEMKEMKPTTKIGETFQYSNYLVMAGGYAAARACISDGNLEDAYASAMKQFVFDPLKMKRTVIKKEDALQLGAALPHAVDFNGNPCTINIDIEKFAYGLAPAGAIWSTVNDMSKYLVAEMNNGVLDEKPIVSEETILERRKPGIKMGEKAYYGLCLMMTNEQGLNVVGHGGATMGFSSDLFFIPEKGIGMVILANTYFAHPFLNAVKQKFMELTFSAQPRSEEMIDSIIQDRKQSIKKNHYSIVINPIDTPWIEKLLGEYASNRLGYAKLSRASDGSGYEMQFQEWKTRVGSETEKNGNKVLVLIDPPARCGIKLLVEDNGDKLVLDAGQEKHEFLRAPTLKKKHLASLVNH